MYNTCYYCTNVLLLFYSEILYFICLDFGFSHKIMNYFIPIFYGLFLYSFFKVGDGMQITNEKSLISFDPIIGRVGVIGVTVMGIIAGYGAIRGPYKSITFFFHYTDPREIEKLEKQLLQTIDIILSRKRRLLIEEIQYNKIVKKRTGSPSTGIKSYVYIIKY